MPSKLTYVSKTINTSSGNDCDNACKRVLALKEIASVILKDVVSEYQNSSIEEIISYISEVEIGDSPVDPDISPVIHTDNSEDSTMTEGDRFYDIKFTARAPGSKGELISLIINIEAQKNYNPGYSILKRGIYYCSRLISSQYGAVFTKSDYDRLRKVYSIWICTNPDKAHCNTITKYSLSPESLFGEIEYGSQEERESEKQQYDLITMVMICLDNYRSGIYSKNRIIKFLSNLLSPTVNVREKKAMLESDYNIKMTYESNEEVDKMCNISEGYIEIGEQRGIQIGEQRGEQRGIQIGEQRGEQRGIRLNMKEIISAMLSDGRTAEEISAILHKNIDEVNNIILLINSDN